MPTIAYFLGIAVAMYYRDHAPPHVHVLYQGYEAVVAIEDARVLRGKLPPTAMLVVRHWITLRRAALLANWQRRANTSLWSEWQDPTTMLIKVRSARYLGGHRMMIEFSDDTVGERDFSFLMQDRGPMVEPLKDPAYFRRAFVEDGVLTWPNGYDWDPIALHDEMKQAGELRPVGDAAE
jgi:hypothetical protein